MANIKGTGGELGGQKTLSLYGANHFKLLAEKRWKKNTRKRIKRKIKVASRKKR